MTVGGGLHLFFGGRNKARLHRGNFSKRRRSSRRGARSGPESPGRSGLRGICRLWVVTNLNTQSSRNLLSRTWLGRAPHKPRTTNTRGSSRPSVRGITPGLQVSKNPRPISGNTQSSFTATTIKGKQAAHVVREAQEAVTVPSRSRDSTANTQESSATFLHVICFPKLEVVFDNSVPARGVAPCCRETATGSHALFNLRGFRAGSSQRSPASTQALAVEPSTVPSRHLFEIRSSAKAFDRARNILFLWVVARVTSKRAQGTKTGNFVGVANRLGMRDLSRPKAPPFTKKRGLLELPEGRRGTLHTVPSERGIRTKHHMGERPAQLTFREPLRPKYEAPPGQPERTSANGQADEPGSDTVDGVPTTRVVLTGRCVTKWPVKTRTTRSRAPPIRRRQRRARWTLQK